MINRIISWIREGRRWRKEHNEAWEGMVNPQVDKLSRFQKECIKQLESALAKHNISLADKQIRDVKGGDVIGVDNEKSITAILPKSGRRMFIYLDGAEIDDCIRLEEWDCRTPDELIGKLIKRAFEVELADNKP